MRRCIICGTRLSQYNDDILCFVCQKKEVEQSIKTMLQQPIRPKTIIRTIKREPYSNGGKFLGNLRAKIKI